MARSIETETLDALSTQMGGQDALVRIIAMYTGRLPEEIDGLRSAVDQGDLAAVQSSAHRLKSSSGQLGARRLSVMLAGLEEAGREGDPDAAGRILNEVAFEADQVRSELGSISP